MEGARLVGKGTGLTSVPAYFYDKSEDVCGISKAGFIWASNLVCAFFHLLLAVTTIIVATQNGKGMDTPTLTVYLTNLTWIPNSTDALIPTNVPAGDGLALAWMTVWFFLLSFLAHTTIVIGNYKQALAMDNPENQKITRWSGWYYSWIHSCRQPLRWCEYSFSASLMIITIAVASGVAHVYMIAMVFALMWCTMTYGYFTEIMSRPEDNGVNKPMKWLLRNGNPDLVLPEIPAAFQRLAPHFAGYVPYIVIWFVLMHSFFYNTGDGGPPGFVYVIVVGQLIVFTGFGATQLANQIDENGPSWYYWGEWSYLALSLFSKGLLGLTLVTNVLIFDNFQEAVTEAS